MIGCFEFSLQGEKAQTHSTEELKALMRICVCHKRVWAGYCVKFFYCMFCLTVFN